MLQRSRTNCNFLTLTYKEQRSRLYEAEHFRFAFDLHYFVIRITFINLSISIEKVTRTLIFREF